MVCHAGTVTTLDPRTIRIPDDLQPADGRFGCGPSKVRAEQIDVLVRNADGPIGTSHRQPPVKNIVGSVRRGLTDLFGLPDGWEIVLGNGGSTCFWDVATFGLIETRSEHLVFGEFSSKFAEAAAAAPNSLGDPIVIDAPVGDHPVAEPADVDVYALTAQRDLDRCRDAAPTPRRPGHSSSSMPPPAPGACCGIPPRSTSTTSPRRSASPPTAGCGWPPSPRPRSNASSASPRPGVGRRRR